MFSEIQESLRQLYLGDARPWLVSFNTDVPCTDACTSEPELRREVAA